MDLRALNACVDTGHEARPIPNSGRAVVQEECVPEPGRLVSQVFVFCSGGAAPLVAGNAVGTGATLPCPGGQGALWRGAPGFGVSLRCFLRAGCLCGQGRAGGAPWVWVGFGDGHGQGIVGGGATAGSARTRSRDPLRIPLATAWTALRFMPYCRPLKAFPIGYRLEFAARASNRVTTCSIVQPAARIMRG